MNIFISYARADDEPFVKQLYQDLTEHGFDVWWDKATMQSRGRTFLQELRDAIEASDRLVAVIGPNAVISDYVRIIKRYHNTMGYGNEKACCQFYKRLFY